jgi:hypothetical protein
MAMVTKNEWIIKLNGMPFMKITCSSYMRPVEVAREIILHGGPQSEEVEWEWI